MGQQEYVICNAKYAKNSQNSKIQKGVSLQDNQLAGESACKGVRLQESQLERESA